MKSIPFVIPFLLSLIVALSGFGQKTLYDIVSDDLNKIQKRSSSAVIVIGPEQTFSITSVRIKSDPNIIIWNWYYILFREKGRNNIVRYVETLTPYRKQKFFKSNPIEFVNGTLFSCLNNNKPSILSEEILPFIHLDTINGLGVYKQAFLMHTFPTNILIHYDSSSFRSFKFKDFVMRSTLMPSFLKMPVNLNYEHNRSTNIYRLYLILRDLLTDVDEKFEFL